MVPYFMILMEIFLLN